MIPEAAVEAAARSWFEQSTGLSWEDETDQTRRSIRGDFRVALGAAASHMLAEAWDAGHNHCFHVEDPRNPDRNPYK